eukprot:m.50493 g.50493  ORF g.50493 m.50493 type:complete len:692 (-) comp13426_c0_seq1:55-2130(-)
MACDRRLLKDMKTLHKVNNPLFNVAPNNDSLREWHVNFFTDEESPFGRVAVHAIFTFPQAYPLKPPKARFLSNLFYEMGVQTSDGELCLSILGDFADFHREWSNDSGAWSAGYSMHDVLLNVYSAILNPDDHTSQDCVSLGKAAEGVECTCGHNGKAVEFWLPQPLEQPLEQPQANDQVTTVAKEAATVETCDGPVEASELENIRFGIRCYTSQCTLDEMLTEPDTDIVFGFGLVIETHGDGSLYKVTSPCEYISHEAWEAGLRKSIYNQRLEYFLPLYLTPEHYLRAEPIRLKLFDVLAVKLQLRHFEVQQKLITSLLAHLVVTALEARIRETMEGSFTLSTWMVEGYFQLWRLAKEMCRSDWLLQDRLRTRVSRFLQNPNARGKRYEPSLGELYAAVAFTEHGWAECRDAIIEESGVRQVKWMLKEYPELVSAEMTDMTWRWNVSSEATRVSRGFQAFNKYFLAHVIQRAAAADVLYSSDARFGVPAPSLAEDILQACIKASELATWSEYFEWMEYDCLTEDATLAYLDKSLERSRQVRYHGTDLDPLMSTRRQAASFESVVSKADEDKDWRARPDRAEPAPPMPRPNGYVPPHLREGAALQGHRPPPLGALPQRQQEGGQARGYIPPHLREGAQLRGRRPPSPEPHREGGQGQARNWRNRDANRRQALPQVMPPQAAAQANNWRRPRR